MPRLRRKEIAGTSLRKHLQLPGEEEKKSPIETGEPALGEIKIWLEDKLQIIGSDVKGLNADFKVLDER